MPVLALAGTALELGILVQYRLWSQLPASAVLAAFFLIGAAVVWVAMRPTFLRVTAEQILANGLDSGFTPSRMPRTELAYIFRGRALVGRYKTWQPAYFLVTHDGTPKIGLLGEAFRDDAMVAFAEKVGVPVKGDFTAQVR